MALTLIKADDDRTDPTDHPHVHKIDVWDGELRDETLFD